MDILLGLPVFLSRASIWWVRWICTGRSIPRGQISSAFPHMQGTRSGYEGYRYLMSLKGNNSVVACQQYCRVECAFVRFATGRYQISWLTTTNTSWVMPLPYHNIVSWQRTLAYLNSILLIPSCWPDRPYKYEDVGTRDSSPNSALKRQSKTKHSPTRPHTHKHITMPSARVLCLKKRFLHLWPEQCRNAQT